MTWPTTALQNARHDDKSHDWKDEAFSNGNDKDDNDDDAGKHSSDNHNNTNMPPQRVGDWFAVPAQPACRHCASQIDLPRVWQDQVTPDPASAPCEDCGHVGETMICLSCRRVFCGRHVQGHMLDHYQETGHAVVLGSLDLSVWCYECDTYLNPRSSGALSALYRHFHKVKFGGVPPGE